MFERMPLEADTVPFAETSDPSRTGFSFHGFLLICFLQYFVFRHKCTEPGSVLQKDSNRLTHSLLLTFNIVRLPQVSSQ
jgi:hypothetical protein